MRSSITVRMLLALITLPLLSLAEGASISDMDKIVGGHIKPPTSAPQRSMEITLKSLMSTLEANQRSIENRLGNIWNKMEGALKSIDNNVKNLSCNNEDNFCSCNVNDDQRDDAGWIVIQRRTMGHEGFHRNWKHYKNGFGSSIIGDFWLGNEAIHNLTSKDAHELRIEVTFHKQTLFAQYSYFKIGNESDNYRLQLGSYSGTLGDAKGLKGFSYHNGIQFSTYDRDNDEWSAGNCARRVSGGWWFKSCVRAHLNGRWVGRGAKAMRWVGIYDTSRILTTKMKIRKI